MPGMHCISHSSKSRLHARGAAARLDGVGQLLGDALGDLAQLAQRPTGLQARQRARQRAHRALVLPRCTASAATPAQQRSPSISLPLFLQARQRARQRAHRALVLPRCTASAATPAQQRSPSISLPMFLQARQRARQRAHRALGLPVVLRRQRHLRSSAPLQSHFLYFCTRASVPDSAPTGLWFFPLYCVGSDTCAAALPFNLVSYIYAGAPACLTARPPGSGSSRCTASAVTPAQQCATPYPQACQPGQQSDRRALSPHIPTLPAWTTE